MTKIPINGINSKFSNLKYMKKKEEAIFVLEPCQNQVLTFSNMTFNNLG